MQKGNRDEHFAAFRHNTPGLRQIGFGTGLAVFYDTQRDVCLVVPVRHVQCGHVALPHRQIGVPLLDAGHGFGRELQTLGVIPPDPERHNVLCHPASRLHDTPLFRQMAGEGALERSEVPRLRVGIHGIRHVFLPVSVPESGRGPLMVTDQAAALEPPDHTPPRLPSTRLPELARG